MSAEMISAEMQVQGRAQSHRDTHKVPIKAEMQVAEISWGSRGTAQEGAWHVQECCSRLLK